MHARRIITVLGAALGTLLFGCSSPSHSDPSLWERSHDLGGKSFDGFEAPGAGATVGTGATGAVPGVGGTGAVPGVGGTGAVPGVGGTGVGGSGAEVGSGGAGGTPPATGGVAGTGGVGGTAGAGAVPGVGGTGAGGAPIQPGNSGPCALTVRVTTSSPNGQYAPKNVGAIWVAATNNQWLQTLEAWGTRRIGNLTNWMGACGGNTVDAITAATLSYHQSHEAHWDCTDLNRVPLPNGVYRMFFEMTDSDSALFFSPPSKLYAVDFPKDGNPQNLTFPDDAFFHNISIVIQ